MVKSLLPPVCSYNKSGLVSVLLLTAAAGVVSSASPMLTQIAGKEYLNKTV